MLNLRKVESSYLAEGDLLFSKSVKQRSEGHNQIITHRNEFVRW